jgi:hypothetical protein
MVHIINVLTNYMWGGVIIERERERERERDWLDLWTVVSSALLRILTCMPDMIADRTSRVRRYK